MADALEQATTIRDGGMPGLKPKNNQVATNMFKMMKTAAVEQQQDLQMLDIFLHIDIRSDNFITSEEMEVFFKLLKEDKALAQNKETPDPENPPVDEVEKFIEEIKKKDYIDKSAFLEICKQYQFDYKKIADKMYDQQYYGIKNRICCMCFKGRLRKVRQQSLIKEWQALLDKKPVELEVSMMSLVSEPVTRMISLNSLMTNVIMIYQTYWISLEPKNIDSLSYKIVIAVQSIAVISLYLISYSTLNYSLYFNGGKGTNLRFENMSGWGSFLLFFHLTFLAPAEFILLEIFVEILLLIQLPILFLSLPLGKCGKGCYKTFEKSLDKFYSLFFGFDKAQIDLFNKQKSLIKLTFTDIPLLIVQVCIIYTSSFPGLRDFNRDAKGNFIGEDGELLPWYSNPYLLINVSVLSTTASVIAALVQTRLESLQLEETFHQHWLNSIKGGFGWIPFEGKMQQRKQLNQSIDYDNIKCIIPYITGKTASYQKFEYTFTDASCTNLTQQLMILNNQEVTAEEAKDSKTKTKHIFTLNKSFSKVSLNKIINLIEHIPLDIFKIDMKTIDWNQHLANSHKIYEIPQNSEEHFELATDSGIPLIQICIDAESVVEDPAEQELRLSKLKSSGSKLIKRDYDLEYNEKMMECLDILLEKKFNPEAQNLYLGQTMLFYALVNRKYTSAEKILMYIQKANISSLKIGRNGMKPIAATVISPNIEYFKRLIEKEPYMNIDTLVIEDLDLNHKSMSFISYLCKKHRVTKGKNNDIKQIFQYIRDRNFTIGKDEDKKRIFRQMVRSFSLNPEEADLDQIWSDYYSIVSGKEVFDLYLGRDMKKENFRLLMGKHYKEEWVNSIQNLAKYCEKYQLVMENVEKDFLRLVAFENNNQKKAIVYFMGVVPASADDRVWGNQKFTDFCEKKMYAKHNNEQLQNEGEKDSVEQNQEEIKKRRLKQEQEGAKKPSQMLVPGPPDLKNDKDGDVDVTMITQHDNKNEIDIKEINKAAIARNVIGEQVFQKTKFSSERYIGKKRTKGDLIILTLIFFLEATSCCDYIGDILVLRQLFGKHPAWATLSIYFMISPFYVSYIPLINFQISAHKAHIKEYGGISTYQLVIAWISKTPLLIIYLLIMDFIFIIQCIIFKPVIFIIQSLRNKISSNRSNLNILDMFEDYMFGLMFEMTKSEVVGFRRLRTISQMIFETIPQIALQIRIFYYFYGLSEDSEDKVSIETIMWSIIFAFIHGVLEVVLLFIESRLFDQPFSEYFVICFNGRLGWVPKMNRFRDPDFLVKLVTEPLDYDNIKKNFCGLTVNIDFSFSNQTAQTLAQGLFKLKSVEEEDERPKFVVGQCMEYVDFSAFRTVLEYSTLKASIDYKDVPLKIMMKESAHFNNEVSKVTTEYEEDDKGVKQPKKNELGAGQMIKNIVSFNHLQIMQKIVEMRDEGDTVLDLTGNQEERHLLTMALKIKSYDMIVCLVKLGLSAKNVWGQEQTFLELRERYKDKHGIEFANDYFGCTDVIPFNLEDFDKGDDPRDQSWFGWGQETGWGARLMGGCKIALDFKNKKFLFQCSYVACIDFGEGPIRKGHPIYTGFDRLYALVHKLYPDFYDDFKFYLYQCGTGYYYEGDKNIKKNDGESLRDYRVRTYMITQRGFHTGDRPVHHRAIDKIFLDDSKKYP